MRINCGIWKLNLQQDRIIFHLSKLSPTTHWKIHHLWNLKYLSKDEDELPYHNNHHRRVFYNVDIIHYYKLLFEVLFCTSSIFLIFQFLYRIISQHILSVIKFHLWHLLLPLLLLQVLLLQVLQPIPLCLLSQPLWLLSLISAENTLILKLLIYLYDPSFFS